MAAPDHPTRSIIDAHPPATSGVASHTAPSSVTERYVLGAEIDRGGMGIIYRATDTVLGREVAVKVLQERYGPASGVALRFADEARITGQLQHPSIPPVHDLGTLPDGRPFLAMKLIKGQTLEESLKARPDAASDRGRFVAAFEQVCQALAYAHSHDVIHRDLKPANVMVGNFGEVQVMDWGLAKVLGAHVVRGGDPQATTSATQVGSLRDTDGSFTQAGSVLGTPAFMPPEQAIAAVGEIDARSDVFGLGAILAVILTGQPPFTADTAETTRIKAARGDVDECFARLDACGADPDLVALCKRCLAPKPADRPANGGEVAKAVAGLRLAADERARRAELERATAEAHAADRRNRRRLWLGAAAVLAVAVVGGLTAVLIVQRRANAELADEQAKVEARNRELADEQVKVQARFDMAVKAIEMVHTGVSEDALLKNDQLKELRTKLLKQAAGFYADLEKLLAGQTDQKSRKTLAEGYFQLAELTFRIGDQTEALAVHRKALAVRRELAAASGANLETQLNVARSLEWVGRLLYRKGDYAGALRAFEEQRDIVERLEALDPTDAVRFVRARSLFLIGAMSGALGKPAEEMEGFRKALAIFQKLVDANPADTEFQSELGGIHENMGVSLIDVGKPAEALEAYRKALVIKQKLVDANPANTEFQRRLGWGQWNVGHVFLNTGKAKEALETNRKALAIFQKLVDDQPAVSEFQMDLADTHNSIGVVLVGTGNPAEALEAYRKALPIQQKLADTNPANVIFQHALANSHNNIGRALDRQKRLAEALTALEAGWAIRLKLIEADPSSNVCIRAVGWSYAFRGGARARAGQPADAAADLRRALELWAKAPHLDLETQVERARALALLAGLGGDAKSGVTAAEAKTFADQSVAALAALVKTGWANPFELKESDFDALRGRADFQKLVAEVEAKAKAGEDSNPVRN